MALRATGAPPVLSGIAQDFHTPLRLARRKLSPDSTIRARNQRCAGSPSKRSCQYSETSNGGSSSEGTLTVRSWHRAPNSAATSAGTVSNKSANSVISAATTKDVTVTATAPSGSVSKRCFSTAWCTWLKARADTTICRAPANCAAVICAFLAKG
jgi:hypothetical protein